MNKELNEFGKVRYPEAIKLPCPRCGWSAALRIGQINFRGELRWFESTNCDKCGLRSEADGVGFPPLNIRELLIDNDGEWCVIMKDVKSTASAVKVLQAALSLDIKAAIALLRTETKAVFRGTKSECLWLVELLEAAEEFPIMLMLESQTRGTT
jgi:hypothetical protein